MKKDSKKVVAPVVTRSGGDYKFTVQTKGGKKTTFHATSTEKIPPYAV